ncbi:hypothetical protein N9121_03100, partial [Pseudomonadales bacterium]|nr:hypothetical protein [Pseudomonadales bacterium]
VQGTTIGPTGVLSMLSHVCLQPQCRDGVDVESTICRFAPYNYLIWRKQVFYCICYVSKFE